MTPALHLSILVVVIVNITIIPLMVLAAFVLNQKTAHGHFAEMQPQVIVLIVLLALTWIPRVPMVLIMILTALPAQLNLIAIA